MTLSPSDPGPHLSPLAADPRPAHSASPSHEIEIHVQNLHKAFNGNPVLNGVDLQVRRGDLIAIVGGSGCGKTVLLEHMIGHYSPDQGRVLVADHDQPGSPLLDLDSLDEEQFNRIKTHWAVVFQRNALFSGTVYDNIALWLHEIRRLDDDAIAIRARAALDAVGFTGNDSILKKDRDELSGGMAKRIAIARALAMDPIILFYDEPTTGLDPAHAAQIHQLIRSTHQRIHESGIQPTTIIVTHDKDLLFRLQPRVVMLHDGRVFFDGSYAEFAQSSSPIILPYFALMPGLQQRHLEPR